MFVQSYPSSNWQFNPYTTTPHCWLAIDRGFTAPASSSINTVYDRSGHGISLTSGLGGLTYSAGIVTGPYGFPKLNCAKTLTFGVIPSYPIANGFAETNYLHDGSTSYTMMFFAKLNVNAADNNTVCMLNSSDLEQAGLGVYWLASGVTPGSILTYAISAGGTSGAYTCTGNFNPTGGFDLYTVTLDLPNKLLTIYANNVLVATATEDSPPVAGNAVNVLTLGGVTSSTMSKKLAPLFDRFREMFIWQRLLSPTELTNMHTNYFKKKYKLTTF